MRHPKERIGRNKLSTTKKVAVVQCWPNSTFTFRFPKTFSLEPSAASGKRSSFCKSDVLIPMASRTEGAMQDTLAPVSGSASTTVESPFGAVRTTEMFSSGAKSVLETVNDPKLRLLA